MKILRTSDKVEFRYNTDVTNCFGNTYKGFMQSIAKNHLNPEISIWIPRFQKKYIRGWKNTFKKPNLVIQECDLDQDTQNRYFDKALDKPRRAIFQKSGNGKNQVINFIGVFEFNEKESTPQKVIFEKTKDEVEYEPENNYLSDKQQEIENEKIEVSFQEKNIIENIPILNPENIHISFREDFIHTFNEMNICFTHDCNMATISLAGKLMELTIKERLMQNNISFDDYITLHHLVNLVTQYQNQELRPFLNVIRNHRYNIQMHRNTVIHPGANRQLPTRNLTASILYGIYDIIQQTYSN